MSNWWYKFCCSCLYCLQSLYIFSQGRWPKLYDQLHYNKSIIQVVKYWNPPPVSPIQHQGENTCGKAETKSIKLKTLSNQADPKLWSRIWTDWDLEIHVFHIMENITSVLMALKIGGTVSILNFVMVTPLLMPERSTAGLRSPTLSALRTICSSTLCWDSWPLPGLLSYASCPLHLEVPGLLQT